MQLMGNLGRVIVTLFLLAQASWRCIAFKFTFKSPSPKVFIESVNEIHLDKFVSKLSSKLNVDKLLQGLDDAPRRVVNHGQTQIKIDLMLELARVYWERILMFNLVQRGNFIQWTDLVQRERLYPDEGATYAEKACIEAVLRTHPLTCPTLVTPVYRFMREFGVPNAHKPLTYTTNHVSALVSTLRGLLLPDDPHIELARNLCDVLELHIAQDILPTYGDVYKRVPLVYSLMEKYSPVPNCRADLPPVNIAEIGDFTRCRIEGKCTIIGL